jgi:plastocyanin
MICRWYICFSLVAAQAATIDGRVVLTDSREVSVRRGKDYSGVVVWLEPASKDAPRPATATILQKGKKFTPHVTAIRVGGTVDLPNLDPIFHNAFSNFAGQPFDTGLYAPGTSQKITFRRAGIVRVFCNIHSTMSAVIAVLDTPYFTVTGMDGGFRLESVPPGEYQIRFWHERASEAALGRLARKLPVTADLTLPVETISESGYLELPHRNKHGREYPPEPGASVTYSGFGK